MIPAFAPTTWDDDTDVEIVSPPIDFVPLERPRARRPRRETRPYASPAARVSVVIGGDQ